MIWASDMFTRHRAWIGAVAALVSLVALLGAGRTQIDDVPSSIFRSDDAEFARLESMFEHFGTDDGDCLVLLEGEDLFGVEAVALIDRLETRLAALDGIGDVWSLADVFTFEGVRPVPLLPATDASEEERAEAASRAKGHPAAEGLLLAPGGEAMILIARLAGSHLSISDMRPRVEAIREVLAEEHTDSLRLSLTGVPPLRVVIFDAITHEQQVFPPLSALTGILIGLFLFRRIAPVALTMAASMMAALWALGFMGWVNEPLNLLTAELPLLVMVIAYTDAIHLMIETLREREAGATRMEAAAGAIRLLGLPCALTSLTTAIGFGSLIISRVDVIRDYGGLFSAAVAMSFVCVLTVVPLGSSFFLRPAKRRSMAERYAGLRAPTEAIIRKVLDHATPVAWMGVAVIGTCLALALQLVPENRLTEATPPGDPATEALHRLEGHFGGVLATAVLIEWDEAEDWREHRDAIAAVEGVLEEHPFTFAPRSILSWEALIPEVLRGPNALSLLPAELRTRFLREDLGLALVTTQVPDSGSAVCDPAYAEINERLAEVREAYPGLEIHLTGTGYLARRNVNIIIVDFAIGLALAALVIFVVLGFAFRSWKLGALSLVPNAFPVVFAAAGLYVFGLELQVASVLAFTVLLGIAVDDTIHFTCRYQRERQEGRDVDTALVNAFVGVGRALIMTTIILGAGFGVTLFSILPTSRLFSLIVVTGLFAALIGDLILLPAVIKAWGSRKPQQESPTAES